MIGRAQRAQAAWRRRPDAGLPRMELGTRAADDDRGRLARGQPGARPHPGGVLETQVNEYRTAPRGHDGHLRDRAPVPLGAHHPAADHQARDVGGAARRRRAAAPAGHGHRARPQRAARVGGARLAAATTGASLSGRCRGDRRPVDVGVRRGPQGAGRDYHVQGVGYDGATDAELAKFFKKPEKHQRRAADQCAARCSSTASRGTPSTWDADRRDRARHRVDRAQDARAARDLDGDPAVRRAPGHGDARNHPRRMAGVGAEATRARVH